MSHGVSVLFLCRLSVKALKCHRKKRCELKINVRLSVCLSYKNRNRSKKKKSAKFNEKTTCRKMKKYVTGLQSNFECENEFGTRYTDESTLISTLMCYNEVVKKRCDR